MRFVSRLPVTRIGTSRVTREARVELVFATSEKRVAPPSLSFGAQVKGSVSPVAVGTVRIGSRGSRCGRPGPKTSGPRMLSLEGNGRQEKQAGDAQPSEPVPKPRVDGAHTPSRSLRNHGVVGSVIIIRRRQPAAQVIECGGEALARCLKV
jgi:hypothetical protein